MKPYGNLNANSNVVAYMATEDSIHVVFKSGAFRNYLYSSIRPGKSTVDRMTQLAEQGYGLNTFISSVVKKNFAKKW